MTRCRWCGMESRDPNVCEWCRRDMRTGNFVQGYRPPTQPAAQNPPTANTPASSQPTVQGAQPLYDYSRPATPAQTPQQGDQIRFLYEVSEGFPFWVRVERFLGVVLPLTAINVLLLWQKPEWSFWTNALYFFLVGLWLPGSHLVDRFDDFDEYRDIAIVLLLNLLCCGNPVVVFALYGLTLLGLWLITRADINWSLLGVYGVYMILMLFFNLVLILVDYADIADALTVGIAFAPIFPLLALFAGWFFGGLVRPEYG
ncbi:MAG: hypothetical protein N2045_03990 [Fimbriimonadales bacterium]|nr:hypothetical protein [Fimbriimonadales bacterium]